MDKFCRPPLRKGDIVTVVQGLLEGLLPKEALTRRAIVEAEVMSFEEATVFLRTIGPEATALLYALYREDLQMACIEMKFVTGHEALQSHYLR